MFDFYSIENKTDTSNISKSINKYTEQSAENSRNEIEARNRVNISLKEYNEMIGLIEDYKGEVDRLKEILKQLKLSDQIINGSFSIDGKDTRTCVGYNISEGYITGQIIFTLQNGKLNHIMAKSSDAYPFFFRGDS